MDEKKKDAPAAAPAKGKEEPVKKDKKPSGSNNNLILLVGIIVIGVLLQVLLPRMIAPARTVVEDSEETEEVAATQGTVDINATEMGATTEETPVEVLVNIAGTDGERFLKAALVMEYIDKSEKKHGEAKKEGEKKEGEKKEGEGKAAEPGIAEAIKQRMPKYKNYLLESLSKLTMAELTAPETKERIRKDFIQMVNNSLPPDLGVVKDIYFTQYIIQ